MKSIDDVFLFMSQCSNLNAEFKSHIGQLIAEVYADGWKSGHKVGRDNAMSVPVTSNVTTNIQDEAMSVVHLECDSLLKLLAPHLNERERIASANAFGETVRPSVAKAISSAWSSAFKLGAKHERAACLDAIEAAASSIVNMPTIEHGGVRTPIPTILPIECYRDAYNCKWFDSDFLKHRSNWVQWPNIMRHEYVQARLVDGKPCVQIVMNGEYKGTVLPNGSIVGVSILPNLSIMSIADNVAHDDAHEKLSPEGVGAQRVPDSRIGLFLFVDSKGNEFELKNTDYGTVIVKGEVVLGKVYRGEGDARGCSVDSSGTFIVKHTECALRMCEEFGALTRAVFAFCRWACDSGAVPQFMIKRVDIPEHSGISVRHDGGRFHVISIHYEILVTIDPDSRGALIANYGKVPFVNGPIIDAAVRTIRSKFYGNMA